MHAYGTRRQWVIVDVDTQIYPGGMSHVYRHKGHSLSEIEFDGRQRCKKREKTHDRLIELLFQF